MASVTWEARFEGATMQAAELANKTQIGSASDDTKQLAAPPTGDSHPPQQPANDALRAIDTKSYPCRVPTAWIYQPARSVMQSGSGEYTSLGAPLRKP